MGYARIIQYADIIEYYEYEKNHIPKRPKHLSKIQKDRKKKIQAYRPVRTAYSARRAKSNFFKVVSNQLYERGAPCMVTLTFYQEHVRITDGYKFIAEYIRNVKKNKMGEDIAYIAVPEWQKKGRLHYHLLVWGLSKKEAEQERDTRNHQRQFGRGYLDVRIAQDNSPKLASYLAKYMVKGYTDQRLAGNRAYTTSRNVKKPRTQGSNTLSAYEDIFLPERIDIVKVSQYNTPYMGRCLVTRYKTNK